MADAHSSEPALGTVTSTVDDRTTEAFEVLGNETRLAILLALWNASEPGLEADGVSFSTLRDRVGIRQGGQFNYHLDKLTGRFIEQTDEGYRLRHAGQKIVQTVIGTAGFEEPTLEPTDIDMPCRHCSGQTALTYDDEWLYRICTECAGTFETNGTTLPEGCLTAFQLDPAAVRDRTPEEMFALAKFQMLQHIHDKMEGICPWCSGPVRNGLDVCEEHDVDGICDACRRAEPVRVRFECLACKDSSLVPLPTCVSFHPEVVTFYYDHDIALQWDVDDFDTLKRIHELIVNEVDLVADDPSRILVTFSHDGDELRLTLDEELNVIDVTK